EPAAALLLARHSPTESVWLPRTLRTFSRDAAYRSSTFWKGIDMFKKVLTLSLAVIGFAGAANAADLRMPYKAPPPIMAPIFSWTGFYIGVNGGGGFGAGHNAIVNETFAGAPFVSGTWPGSGNFGKLDPSGGFGGGQIGCNYQVQNWVFGVETDIQGA